MNGHLLTIITVLPVIGAVLLLLIGRSGDESKDNTLKWIALLVSVAVFIVSLALPFGYSGGPGLSFEERVPWIHAFDLNMTYHVGIDGLSMWLVLLTTFLVPLSILVSWKAVHYRMREFLVAILALETGMIGVFVAMDFLVFYFYWEVMLVPMYFLIGVWGSERRIYAAVKFVIYTVTGSLLMLAGIIGLYYLHAHYTGIYTFDIATITQNLKSHPLGIDAQRWLFVAFGLAFFIKVPLFPFHTWLPDAHVEAPTAGSVLLAGVLLKMGTYGLMRFNLPLFPEASHQYAPFIATLAVIGIIYGALVAMVQPDMKKLVAYSSVSHLGFVVLGIFSFSTLGMQGALYQMLNHGVSTGALFMIVGMIYERRHTKLISEFGGLASVMPVYSTLFMIVTLSSIALPLLNGFVGEFLILFGTFTSSQLAHARLFATFAATGMILSAIYMLWMYQRVIFGETRNPENLKLADVNLRERFALAPAIVMIFVMGIFPSLFLNKSHSTVRDIQTRFAFGTRSLSKDMTNRETNVPAQTEHISAVAQAKVGNQAPAATAPGAVTADPARY
ncbi:MAG TPA: NADH-quinone oxidoreductase subunit M [Blastocatellia bacterium]|nr:NADH-quinone oxidoreductase subunit M [Blastocatellia bacterium]